MTCLFMLGLIPGSASTACLILPMSGLSSFTDSSGSNSRTSSVISTIGHSCFMAARAWCSSVKASALQISVNGVEWKSVLQASNRLFKYRCKHRLDVLHFLVKLEGFVYKSNLANLNSLT